MPFERQSSQVQILSGAALNAYEADIVSERTKQGMTTHKAKGSRFGRKAKITPAKALAAKRMLDGTDMSVDEVASHFKELADCPGCNT